MDYRFSFQRPMRRNSFCSMKGTIVDLVPAGQGGRRADGCLLFATIEDTDGNTVNFFINPDTYVVDFTTLSVGMMATFWYRNDAPMPLIYPPQYTAAVIAAQTEGQMVYVGYFNNILMSSDQGLKLNLAPSTVVVTQNNQTFQGSPAGHTLVVLYSQTTRSIPPQTTPDKIIVLCGE